MGLFARLKTGWALAMDSLRIVRREPSLGLFPLIAGVAGIVYLAGINGLAFTTGLLSLGGGSSTVVTYGLLFVLYLGSTFIASFFTAALMHNAREVFRGSDPTLNDGLRAAYSKKGQLLVWSVVAATVGVILRAVESSDSPVSRIAAALFSVAWSILTYFIVPVIVFEDVGVTEMFERSGQTFKQTWGETAGASFGVGLVTIAFVLVGLVLGGAVTLLLFQLNAVTGLITGVVVFLAVVLFSYLFSSALTGVARTALYVYATTGERPSGFEDVDFEKPTA